MASVLLLLAIIFATGYIVDFALGRMLDIGSYEVVVHSDIPPAGGEQASEMPLLDYCDLANHPEKYDGKKVRVSATLYFMMHGYKFMDKACLGDEKETAVLLDGDHEARLAKEMGVEEYNPWSFPQIVATGKFTRVTPNRKSDTVADNSHLIFEMDAVERVIK